MTEFRPKLLSMSATLDQLLPTADAILDEPIYPDIYAMAEELRELLADMQACVGQHLDE
jgi:hypothetical protein